jgi:hypothetical protein
LGLASLRENLRILEMAGVISAVADDDERLFFETGILQMPQALADGIVERRSSARGDGMESFLEFLGIVRKRFSSHEFNGHVVVEIHDEHLILGIARMREGSDRSDDTVELGTHASAVVHDEADCYRSVSLIEDR